MFDCKIACELCSLPYTLIRYPAQFGCDLLCCEECVNAGRHFQKKTQLCVKHNLKCFKDEKHWKSLDIGPVIEKLEVAQVMMNLVTENRPV
jgi:hypothetical protein